MSKARPREHAGILPRRGRVPELLNLELSIRVYFWFNPTQSPWGVLQRIEPGIEYYGLFLAQSNPVATGDCAGN